MKENENKKSVVRVTEGSPKETADVLQNGAQNNKEKLKKIAFVEHCLSSPTPCSPVDASPMEAIEIHGVRVYRCARSGGIWMDKEAARSLLGVEHETEEGHRTWLSRIMQALVGD